MTINHRAIFYLIEPEGCWHEWKGPDTILSECIHCGKRHYNEGTAYNPDFTLPEWRIRLQEWLCDKANEHFADHFFQYVTDEYFEDVTCKYRSVQIMLLGSLEKHLTEFLGTEECKREFGWEEICKSPHCYVCNDCGMCDGSGFIKRPWLRAQEAS